MTGALLKGSSHSDLNVINSVGIWWHFNGGPAVTLGKKKKKSLHYICVAAPAEVTAKDHQTEHCLPGACRAIQSFRVEFSVWRADLLFIRTASPGNVHKSTNALCITQMIDTLIPWESLAMKGIFFIFYHYFPALFSFLLRFSAGSQCVTGFFLHQGLASLRKRKVQYGFLTYFLVLREGFFTPSF